MVASGRSALALILVVSTFTVTGSVSAAGAGNHAPGAPTTLTVDDDVRPTWASTITWESWNAREVGDSESHGWGSTVLAVLQERILGVRIAEQGGARVDLAIPDSSLAHAQGIVATQRGPIAVAWTRSIAHTTLDITIPPNVVATLPGGRALGSGHYRLRDYRRASSASKNDTTRVWLVGAGIVLAAMMGAWLLVNRRFRKVAE